MQVGMIGLGRMGANMVRRWMQGGHTCVVHDVSRDGHRRAGGRGRGPGGVAGRLPGPPDPTPRHLVDGAGRRGRRDAGELAPRLAEGDVIVDGGNSYYRDDIRPRQAAGDPGLHYVDVGTSGGVWGLERGYCLMIGGEKDVVSRLDPIFATLAPGAGTRAAHARAPAAPAPPSRATCTAAQRRRPLRQDGPNGIEYGLMAAYAEGLNVLRHANVGKQHATADAETAPLRTPSTTSTISISRRSPKCGGAAASSPRGCWT